MEIHFFAKSDLGRIRTTNEDFYLSEKIARDEYVFIVADGMGGHQAGDVASRLATESFFETYRQARRQDKDICGAMLESVQRANEIVYRIASEDLSKRGMGTTFSALVVKQERACIVHIGDSRVYRVRQGRLQQLTRDHSFVEKLVEDGVISSQEAKNHPQKNVLYLSLGSRDEVTPQLVENIDVQAGDVFIMCSDGLSNHISEDEMVEMVQEAFPEDIALLMVETANARGGTDNITVQVVKVGNTLLSEDTKPDRIVRGRSGLVKAFSVIGVLVLLAFLVWLFFSLVDRGPKAPGGGSEALELSQLNSPGQDWQVQEIEFEEIDALPFTPEEQVYLSAGIVFRNREGRLEMFQIGQPSELRDIGNLSGDLVPASGNRLYTWRIDPGAGGGSGLFREGITGPILNRNKLRERDRQFMGDQHKINPLFVHQNHFFFHDGVSFFAVSGLQSGDKSLRMLNHEITIAAGSRFFFNRDGDDYWMTFLDLENRTVKAFNLPDLLLQDREEVDRGAEILAMEYSSALGFVIYYPDSFLETKKTPGGKQAYPLAPVTRLSTVLLDLSDGRRVLFTEDRRLFLFKGKQ